MEHRSVSENKEYFQKILREFEGDPLLEVHDAEQEAGTKLGDNYMSVVIRTLVRGKRGNGNPYNEAFISKHCPHYRPIAKLIRNAELFHNEAHVYKHILPHLRGIAPRCIFANGDEIILEDLRVDGYQVQPRLELLDLQHSTMVLKKLASMHAQSLALKLNEPEQFAELMAPLKESVFPDDGNPSMGATLESAVDTAINQIASLEDESGAISRAIDFITSQRGQVLVTLKRLIVPGQGKFDVISHGDVWNNNILFKHNQAGQVIDVKLVDFQIVRHTSAAVDFHYFVYSSVKNDVIQDHYDELVQVYQASLQECLQKLKVNEEIIHKQLTLHWFKSQLKDYSKYGLFTSFWLVNAVLAHDEDMINMDNLTPEFLEKVENLAPPVRENKAERIKCTTLHYMHTYL